MRVYVQIYKSKMLNEAKVLLIFRQYVQGSRVFRCFPSSLEASSRINTLR